MIDKILLTVLIVTAMNAVLAVILVIAERFLANYGTVRIRINEDKTLEVQGGSSLLASLNSHKIFLPSACGGRGTCGYCKCEIQEGAGPLLPTEAPLLTETEIGTQIRIACQVKVREDMQIRIPEALFNIHEFSAEVMLLEDLTYDIKLCRLKLIDPPGIHFKAGQYIQLRTKPYDQVRESVSRAYSIASPAFRTDQVDLMIRLVPDGICTTWVHRVLKQGDRVTFVGPMGDFQVHGQHEEMVLAAGGSGMAPMVSILHDMAAKQVTRKITFFFGAVSRKDLFYIDEMKELEKSIPDFTFVPSLSSPDPGDQWQGETGLVTVSLERYLKIADCTQIQGYLCGSPGLINACVKVMEACGVTRDRIYFDPFA
ncbi:2Fe-2S iron-sulfur cluster binding domain-containing protein [bacterium]|nr:2Fe-2S iron-sulfur cluster binding domain-containing protein [bacterium]